MLNFIALWNRIINQYREHVLLTSLIVTGLLFLFVLVIFTPAYETNDDTAMALSVAGKVISDTPNPYIRNSNIIIGFLLSTLHKIIPSVSWYAFYLLFTHFAAMVLLLYSLLTYKYTVTRIVLFIIYFIFIEIHFLMNLQFTSTSCIAAIAGLLLFYVTAERGRASFFIISGGVIFWASLMRLEAIYLVLAMFFPLAVFRVRQNVLKYVLFFVIVLSLCVGAWKYNNFYLKKDGAWNEYFEKVGLLQKFLDFQEAPYNESTKPYFDKVNWTFVDYVMLMTWNFSDKVLFSAEKMKEVLANFPSLRLSAPVQTISRYFRLILSDRGVHYILFVLVLFGVCTRFTKEKALSLLFILIVLSGLLSYMMLFMKLERRVYLSMFSFIAAVALLFADFEISTKSLTRQRLAGWIGVLVAVIMSVSVFSLSVQQSRFNKYWNQEVRAAVQAINPRAEQLYVVWGPAFPFERLLPFDGFEYLENFKVLWLCGLTVTPFFDERMKSFQIEDINKALYEKQNVFVFIPEQIIRYYAEFVKAHYGDELEFGRFSGTNVFSLYKVTKK
ncbi:MAG: hypothetical protein L3V56_06095 [Candidatus Magnetoovum sp. WYHC-5]|nr:hypothetical protein [Candidatus Magnetoovum sp. WYHC-5]